MSDHSSWREVLSELIRVPAERERIAAAIGVHAVTLSRWVQGASLPRTSNIRQLIKALPDSARAPFVELLEKEHVASGLAPHEEAEIDYHFLMQVHRTRSTTPEELHLWSISHLVLQRALRQLDPDELGMAIYVVQCMQPSSEGKIRSLRETFGLGTPPWKSHLEEEGVFLGAESLAGYVVSSGRAQAVQNLAENGSYLPAYQSEYEKSAMAAPLFYANRIAGCLLVSSTQENYFLAPTRRTLIEDYAHLAALAFLPQQFYPLESIGLAVMPAIKGQRQLFSTFRARVVQHLTTALHNHTPLTTAQAEQLAWHDLEAELIASLSA